MADLVVETTKQLGVDGWWPRNSVAASDFYSLCEGLGGASRNDVHWAPENVDFFADAQKAASYWRSLGMTVRVEVPIPRPIVLGDGGPTKRASFATGAADNSYSVVAEAPCAIGDFYELLLEGEAPREAGIFLPGDQGVVKNPDPRLTPRPDVRNPELSK